MFFPLHMVQIFLCFMFGARVTVVVVLGAVVSVVAMIVLAVRVATATAML